MLAHLDGHPKTRRRPVKACLYHNSKTLWYTVYICLSKLISHSFCKENAITAMYPEPSFSTLRNGEGLTSHLVSWTSGNQPMPSVLKTFVVDLGFGNHCCCSWTIHCCKCVPKFSNKAKEDTMNPLALRWTNEVHTPCTENKTNKTKQLGINLNLNQ